MRATGVDRDGRNVPVRARRRRELVPFRVGCPRVQRDGGGVRKTVAINKNFRGRFLLPDHRPSEFARDPHRRRRDA